MSNADNPRDTGMSLLHCRSYHCNHEIQHDHFSLVRRDRVPQNGFGSKGCSEPRINGVWSSDNADGIFISPEHDQFET